MHEYKNIRMEMARPGVLLFCIDRPTVMNALDDPTVLEIISAFDEIAASDDIRAIVIGSGERAFSAGSDLDEALSADPVSNREHWDLGQQMMRRIEKVPIPVIAAVRGFAMGGGFELALACDLRLAGESSVFALPEVTLGAIPSWGGTQRLPHIAGRGRALELIMTGRRLTAATAYTYGIVNQVVADDEVVRTALDLAEQLTAHPRRALAAAKDLVRASEHLNQEMGERLETLWNTDCVNTQDFQDRVGAFIARRARTRSRGA